MTAYPEKQTAISGIGQSKITRGADKSALALTIDATLQAIENAGLKRVDIDGMACWPGGSGEENGFAPTSIPVLQDALRLQLNWYSNASETSGQYGALFNAIGAIAAGLARHVIVYRTMYEATARKTSFANALNTPGERVYGIFNWYAPYHTYAAALQQALFFNQYIHKSGIKPEQVAQIAINGRKNAALNPNAIYRTPITIDDYMAAPIIATPLRLLDCDVPIDGATAIILSHRDAAKDGPNPLTWIEAVGSSMRYRNNWVQLDALATQAQPEVAKMMWNRTDLTVKDIDVAELYDGFSYHTINWLENLGVCGTFEAKDFIEGGTRIALDGEFPINTNGGALSAGRMHAYGQVHEACTQLWSLAGDRQVTGKPKVAVMTTAGGPLAGCFLLARE